MSSNSEECAFPSNVYLNERLVDCTDGCTKREYFAIKAFQGLLANPNYSLGDNLAQEAVIQADKLLNSLKVN